MTEFRFVHRRMPAAELRGESTLPALNGVSAAPGIAQSRLDEDDELFISYGNPASPFPYRMQDNYTRALYDTDLLFIELENEHLRASFLPAYGGKLWSLFDKDAGRELLFANPVVRPCNLAIRNAWTSGGVEWNCGMVGHHPFTCSTLHTAKTALADGTPVLRMYEYERVRGVVYQMDFFLPEGSRVLYARMRIVNDAPVVVPMYWWSNIAVPEAAGSRVLMDTDETYNNRNGIVGKNTVPVCDGIDITYPTNNPHSIDFFWKIPKENRKYVCQLDRGGYGLIQTSTSRLQGRKLFVWGQGPGGDRWQQFLTADDSNGRYVEIQAGLAHTQYEHLPMPPKTAWEWLEAYGPLQADPAAVHGAWDGARREVNARLAELVDEKALEVLLTETRAMAKSPAQEMILHGSAWGAVENRRRAAAGEEALCPHLDFGEPDAESAPWISLLEKGELPALAPDAAPVSWITGEDWMKRLRALPENWLARLYVAAEAFSRRDFRTAREELAASEALCPSVYGDYLAAQLLRVEGKGEESALRVLAAARRAPGDLSLVKEAFRVLCDHRLDAEIDAFYGEISPDMRANSRVRICYALAELRLGALATAEAVLESFRSEVLADIREGETSVTELWYLVEEEKARRAGLPFDRDAVTPPAEFDFRMNAEKKK